MSSRVYRDNRPKGTISLWPVASKLAVKPEGLLDPRDQGRRFGEPSPARGSEVNSDWARYMATRWPQVPASGPPYSYSSGCEAGSANDRIVATHSWGGSH